MKRKGEVKIDQNNFGKIGVKFLIKKVGKGSRNRGGGEVDKEGNWGEILI